MVINKHIKPKIFHIPQWKEVKGIAVGACIQRYEADLEDTRIPKAVGHAHIEGKYRGWICTEKESNLGKIKGRTVIEPSIHLQHEYRHILAKSGHTNKWRNTKI